MEKIDLFCLPFAGGNKHSYRNYEKYTPSFVNLSTLEYPGRGTRLNEPLLSDINLIVDDCYLQIKDRINDNDYVLYGHSMGGLVAYLLLKIILLENKRLPLQLFITGTIGPSSPLRGQYSRHLMPKAEFLNEIIAFKGLPDEIVENKEMLNFIEPIIRSDFMAAENYGYKEDGIIFEIPITVITGSEENMPKDDVQLWQKETSFPVDFKVLPGNHFFIYDHAFYIVKIMIKKIISSIQ